MLTTHISMLALPVDCPCTDPSCWPFPWTDPCTDLDISSSFDGLDCPIGFPLSVPVLSWLFDARGKLPKEPFPVCPPADTRRSALATLAAQAARQQSTGSELGPPSPALRANPFPKVTDSFCRLPLPTLFHRPEAVHLGDLMRL
ncbi:unnamed protein product [Brassica rapa]|uniref:Uncharacterized protein n=1 Tax=Brassica campestris TaxID=3711 RepID=A0A8D9FZM8_BRACM|nr:unnamed protein product [Brassica rapa]